MSLINKFDIWVYVYLLKVPSSIRILSHLVTNFWLTLGHHPLTHLGSPSPWLTLVPIPCLTLVPHPLTYLGHNPFAHLGQNPLAHHPLAHLCHNPLTHLSHHPLTHLSGNPLTYLGSPSLDTPWSQSFDSPWSPCLLGLIHGWAQSVQSIQPALPFSTNKEL